MKEAIKNMLMRKPWLGLVVVVLASFVTMTVVEPVLAADDRDTSSFIIEGNPRIAPNEYSGAFTYSYPLRLPPGRNGLQPQLGLSYSSANTDAGNIAGYGWDISIPKIERLSKYGTDDLYGRHDFSSSLSGELEDISLVDATHGDFAAKVDENSFLTYEYTTSETWIVTDKSGTVFTFGAVANARVVDPNDSTHVYAWYLSEIRDTNDNTVTYTYAKDGNQVYPSNINYTGNGSTAGVFDIAFNREARSDDYVSQAAGFTVTTDERIASINVKVSSATVWTYDLDYTAGDNGVRSLLTSITESGKPPVTFTYSAADRSFTEDTGFTFPFAIGNTGTSSLAVYMFDVTGDALPDVVKSSEYVREVYINNGDNTWTLDTGITLPFGFVTSIGRDKGVRVFDVDGDGLQDLVSSKTDSVNTLIQSVYINDGDGTGWTQDTSISVPLAFVNDSGLDMGVRTIDVDGDGMQDIVKALNSQGVSYREVYVNNGDGTGWTLDTGYTVPLDFTISAGLDNGVRPADINGDQLIDLIQGIDTGGGNPMTQAVYINKGDGTGWTQDTNYTVPKAFIVATNARYDNGVRLMDINGDSLVDFVYARQNSVGDTNDALYIHKGDGTGWTEDTSFVAPRAFTSDSGLDLGVREGDIDGDMLDDIVYSRDNGAGSWTDQLFIPDGERADLLTGIDFSQGGSSSVVYTSSVADNSDLFFPLQVVESVTTDDGYGNTATTSYAYEQGSYYYSSEYDRKLAGFGKVTTTDAMGNVSIDYFHQGNTTDSTHGESTDDDSKIRKQYRQEIYDDADNLFKTSITNWTNTSLGNGRDFVFANYTLELVYDGDSDHKDTATDYTYSATTGNLIETEFFGAVTGYDDGTYADTGTDEIVTTYAYATDSNGIILNAVKAETVEGNATTDKITTYFYDSLSYGSVDTGNMTKQVAWIGGTDYATTEYVYNAYGLMTSAEDAEGSFTTYTYHSTQPLQPLTVTNDLSHVTTYEYDLATGGVTEVTQPNGAVTATTYDDFGRPLTVEQSQPGGGATLDTVAEYVYDDDGLPNSVHETKHLDGSTSVNTYTYLDGLGRVIQIRKEAETSTHYSVNDTSYNDKGQVAAISLSYDSTGTAKTTMTTDADLLETYTYDALGRVIEVDNATGTTTSVYDQWVSIETDGNGESKAYANNARGLLVAVVEVLNSTNYTTTYTYNVLGNLTKYEDASGNVRNFTYDKLGRRTGMEDLHATSDTQFGSWSYTYNKVGNLLTTTDANGKVITNAYDDLHRLLTENDPATGGTDVTYTYDTGCTNGTGSLCSVTDVNGVTTAYTYNALGRTATIAQTVDSTQRTTTNTYNRLGDITVIQHPDSTKQEFTYGTAGRISSVGWRDSGNTLNNLVSSVTYAPHGAVDTITYANGVSTTYDYDEDELYRLRNKTTVKSATQFQDFTYTYDAVGNITDLVDAPTIYAQVTHAMTYDDLHRLTQAAATSTDGNLSGTRNYTYNILGNILTGPLGTYQYQSTTAGVFSNPHAVTQIAAVNIAYDKNGNMTSDSVFTNTWDFKNRLITSAKTGNTISYLYDYTGNRVKKTDTTSGVPTYYVDGSYEIEGGNTRHHVSAPGIGNIATVTTTTTTTTYAYHHTDHLGGTHTETDASGNLLQYMVYEPFGKIRYNYKAGSYGNDYTFTGKELDSETSLQYFGARYFSPIAGRFISNDPVFLAIGVNQRVLPTLLRDPQLWNSYSYVRNSPINHTDSNGQFLDIVLDIAFAVADIYDLSRAIGQGDWGGAAIAGASLLADAGSALIPGVTGGGLVVRAIAEGAAHADEVVGAGLAVGRGVESAGDALSAGRAVGNGVDLGKIDNVEVKSFGKTVYSGSRDLTQDVTAIQNGTAQIRDVYQNTENYLAPGEYGRYVEYEVKNTPGFSGSGAGPERIVQDTQTGALYYSPDHYSSPLIPLN